MAVAGYLSVVTQAAVQCNTAGQPLNLPSIKYDGARS